MAEKSIEVFFSYSHNDEAFKDELVKHLSILQRQKIIAGWHDRMISPGSEWDHEIDSHLNSADIILLLISSDFLHSEYCWGVEVQKAMERHEAGDAIVIPIVLRWVDWKDAPFAKLQALPKNAKPIKSWTDQDEAFYNVSQGIHLAVEQLRQKRKEARSNPSSQELQTSLETSLLNSAKISDKELFYRGIEKWIRSDYQGAIAIYDQLIQLKPNSSYAYMSRGIARSELGDKKGAIADYQKAANLYQQQGKTKDYQDALNAIKKLQL